MHDFLTLMLPMALALTKTKNHHLFDPLVRKYSFYISIESFQWLETIGQKGQRFLFFLFSSMLEQMVTFLGLKIHTFPEDVFF